jgi:uncharacterized coiled-coil DUF342 family protein
MDTELERTLKTCEEILLELPTTVQQALEKLVEDNQQTHDILHTSTRELNKKLASHQSQLQSLRSKREELLQRKQQLSEDYKSSKEKVDALRKEVVDLKVLRERVENISIEDPEELTHKIKSQQEVIDHLTNKISLYCNCTHIRWKYDDENALAGYILKGGETKNFRIEPKLGEPLINYETVNALWKVIEDE